MRLVFILYRNAFLVLVLLHLLISVGILFVPPFSEWITDHNSGGWQDGAFKGMAKLGLIVGLTGLFAAALDRARLKAMKE